jgi:hypothetical protein
MTLATPENRDWAVFLPPNSIVETMVTAAFRTLFDELTDESFRTAVLVGCASIPFTIGLSLEFALDDGPLLSLHGGPMIATGLLIGYLYTSRPVDSHRAGLLAGVAASTGGVIVVASNISTQILSSQTEVSTVKIVATPFALVLVAVCLAALVMVCAMVGNWVAKLRCRHLPTT